MNTNGITRSLILLLLSLSTPVFSDDAHQHCASELFKHQPLNDLPLSHWHSESSPEAIIIALHSYGDYRRSFDLLGPWLAHRGYSVYAWDQRGFGEHPKAGQWPGSTALVTDLEKAATGLKACYQRPLYVLGESMGGSVALLAAAKTNNSIDGLILAAPAVREGLRSRYLWNVLLAIGSTLAPAASWTLERNPDNPRLATEHARRLAKDDRIIQKVRMDSYYGLIRLADQASDQAPRVDLPVLLFFGGEDHMVPTVAIKHLTQHLNNHLEYHFLPEAPHRVLQNPDWQQQARQIHHWLQQPSEID